VAYAALWVALGAGGLLTWLFITDSLRDMGTQSFSNLHPVLLEVRGTGEQEIGTLFSFGAVIYLLVSLFGTRLIDRWGPVRALAASGFLQAIALFILVAHPEQLVFWLFAALTAVALGLGDPAFDAFLAKSTSAKTLGLTFGLFSSAISILSTPMPYLGSLLWDGVWFGAPFVMGAVFLIIAGVLTWVVLPKKVAISYKL
jgi:MFS family permease